MLEQIKDQQIWLLLKALESRKKTKHYKMSEQEITMINEPMANSRMEKIDLTIVRSLSCCCIVIGQPQDQHWHSLGFLFPEVTCKGWILNVHCVISLTLASKLYYKTVFLILQLLNSLPWNGFLMSFFVLILYMIRSAVSTSSPQSEDTGPP